MPLITPIVLDLPIRSGPCAEWLRHSPFAFWLMETARPALFVELGTHDGISYSAFAQAVTAAGLQTSCYGVDTRDSPGDEEPDWSAFHLAHFGRFSSLVRSGPGDAALRFDDRSVDVLHVNGFGDPETVKRAIDAWLPKLSDSAVLLLHPVATADRSGNGSVWRDLAHAVPSFTFIHAGGLGVAAVGSTPPPAVSWLTGLRSEHDAGVVRRFFESLGDLAHLRLESTHSEQREEVMAGRALTRARPSAEALEGRRRLVSAPRWQREGVDGALPSNGTRISHAESGRHSMARTGGATLEHRERRDQEPPADQREAHSEPFAEDDRLAAALDRLFELLEETDRRLRTHAGGAAAHASQSRLQHQHSTRTEIARAGTAPGWRSAFRQAILDPADHRRRILKYLRSGSHEATLSVARTMWASGLFDADYYASQGGLNAPPLALAWHYEVLGRFAALNPHPLFDTTYYLVSTPDAERTGSNPLVHFLARGAQEGRDPHPLFSVRYYRQAHPELVREDDNPLLHFLGQGVQQQTSPNPFFDTSFYLRRYPDVRDAGINPLEHYVRFGAAQRRDPSPYFSTGFYLDANPDVADSGVNPLTHYLESGIAEQRAPAAQPPRPTGVLPTGFRPSIALYVSSLGNYFFHEIAEVLLAGLQELGLPTSLRSERDGVGPEQLHLALAPHELFTLGDGARLLRALPWTRTIICNTEQPKSRWFGPVRGLLGRMLATWDIDYSSCNLIRAEGFDCHYVPIGHSCETKGLTGRDDLPLHYGTCSLPEEWFPRTAAWRPWRERPIDVLFVGHLSDRRNALLSDLAPVLATLESVLHFSDVSKPVIPGVTSYMDTRTVIGLAQRSKIILNLHHGHGIYFEWQRMVIQGILQGTLVLTEPSAFAPPLEAGRHYLTSPVSELGAILRRLVETESGQALGERVAAQGHEFLMTSCRISDYLADAVADLLAGWRGTR